MVRAGCAATTCAPAPRSFTLSASQWPDHRGTSRTYHSFTLRACLRQGRRVSSTPHHRFLIDTLAIRNVRNSPANNSITFSNRHKIACLRAHFALLASPFSNLLVPFAIFLIASRQLLEFVLTPSQQMRKLFLIASFSALFNRSCLVKLFAPRSRPSPERRDRALCPDKSSSEPRWPPNGRSLTVARRSSKLLVSTGPAIRSSARAAINCEGEDRCRNALFSRMCGAAIRNTAFASA
jgi:hypothetical protein